MKQAITLLLLLSHLLVFSQTTTYSRLKINLENKSIEDLSSLGFEVDHGILAKGRYIVNEYPIHMIQLLEEYGYEYEILIADMQAFYTDPERSASSIWKNDDSCNEADVEFYDYDTPVDYKDGSMGGYLTWQEMLNTLDDMRSKYPELISEREAIGNLVTVDGNQIYSIKISDNVDAEEDEPEVLYTALHHAREPNSLSQMIFYMWYLLENYDSDDQVRYLVDHTQMHFIPCVNPDGYRFNESIAPDGGGGWRKNRWQDDDGEPWGVDLNRNYGFNWAWDNFGSSPNPQSEVFRGESPFSEVETQAVRLLCLEHDFELALNYHTFGNYLVHPWGFDDGLTEDDDIFKSFGRAMADENSFLVGTGMETVGYTVNGDSDDWMYGEQLEKNKILSFTPEVGSNLQDGFWPLQDRIDLLNKSSLRMNMTLAHLTLDKALVAEQNSDPYILNRSGVILLDVTMLGLRGGSVKVRMESTNSNVLTIGDMASFDLDHFEKETVAISFLLADDTPRGEIIEFRVVLDYGIFEEEYFISKEFLGGFPEEIYTDSGDDLLNWKSFGSGWEITSNRFVSASSSITDSEESDYGSNEENVIFTSEPLDLTNASFATVNFWAQWAIETDFDYVIFSASTDQINWIPLCGQYTNAGSNQQLPGEPLYDGFQQEWVFETVGLNDFLGEKVYFSFELVSDQFLEFDGFYFDDFTVNVIEEESTSTVNISDRSKLWVLPNLIDDQANIVIETSGVASSKKNIGILNSVGVKITEFDIPGSQMSVDLGHLFPGIYFVELLEDGLVTARQRIIIQ